MANRLTDENITKSLNKWFIETYADSSVEVDLGNADQIDETRISKYVYFSVDDITERPQSLVNRASNRECQVMISVTCYGRSNTNVHAALSPASAIREMVTYAAVPVIDFDSSDDEVIGAIKFREAQVMNQTSLQADSRIDVRVVTCEGMAGVGSGCTTD